MPSVQLAHGRPRRCPQGDDETPQESLPTHPNIPLLLQKYELVKDRDYLRLVACPSELSDVTEAAYRAAGDAATPFERPGHHRPRDVASPPCPRPPGRRRRRRAVRLGQGTGGGGGASVEGAGRAVPPALVAQLSRRAASHSTRTRTSTGSTSTPCSSRPGPSATGMSCARIGSKADRYGQRPEGGNLQAARPHRVPVMYRQALAQRPQDVVPDRQGRDAP